MRTGRLDVFQVINEERDYQDQVWPCNDQGQPRSEHNHSLTEFLVYIRSYVEQGLEKVSHSNGDGYLLDTMRKIAGLTVAAMEAHGVKHRPARLASLMYQIDLGGLSPEKAKECVAMILNVVKAHRE